MNHNTSEQLAHRMSHGAVTRIRNSRKILYAVFCTLVLLVALEGLVRVRAWARFGTASPGMVDGLFEYDEEIGLRVPKPGVQQTGDRLSITINSLGFRGREFSIENPADTIRIVCLGASTTFCAECTRNEATWPHRLQELLQKRHDLRVEVINAGVPGYRIADSYQNLKKRVLPLSPDLVILYHANNDMATDTRRLGIEMGIVDATDSKRPRIISILSRYSLLVDLIYKNLKIQSGGSAEKLAELPADLPQRFTDELGKIHRTLEERDIDLVMSTFLTKYRRGQDRETLQKNSDVAFYYTPWMTGDSLVDAIDLYNAAILEFADSRNIPVVRDRDSIPADDEHFADCIHLADAGCEKMAQRFANFLSERRIIESIVEKKRDRPAALRGDVKAQPE